MFLAVKLCLTVSMHILLQRLSGSWSTHARCSDHLTVRRCARAIVGHSDRPIVRPFNRMIPRPSDRPVVQSYDRLTVRLFDRPNVRPTVQLFDRPLVRRLWWTVASRLAAGDKWSDPNHSGCCPAEQGRATGGEELWTGVVRGRRKNPCPTNYPRPAQLQMTETRSSGLR